MALTKSHLIEAIAETNGFTKNKSTQTVEILLEIIKSTLESGKDVMEGDREWKRISTI